MYIYIYIEREREIEIGASNPGKSEAPDGRSDRLAGWPNR